eukprot:evm.model.scf_17.6 EVM.evm.TU.scf_17.6   scf_17:76728-98390(+)
MGDGGVLVAFGGGQVEAPRLTTMLRAFTTARGSDFDADAEYIKRRAALKNRKEQRATLEQLRAPGRTPLAQHILGEWMKAPKAAKQTYENFLKVVSELVGGEHSSDELQEYAATVWGVRNLAPPKDKIKGRGSTAALQPLSDALISTFGHIEVDALQSMVLAQYELKQWQDKLSKPIIEHKKAQVAAGIGLHAELLKRGACSPGPTASFKQMEQEFGSDVDFVFPEINRSQEDALLSTYGVGPEAVSVSSVPLPPALPKPISAQEMQALYTSQPPTEFVEPESSDDEGEAQMKVGIEWLKQWADSTASSVGHQSEELALAVCRALLTTESGDQVASDLCDLLGWDAFELISKVVENRTDLKTSLIEAIARARAAESAEKSGPSYSRMMTIASESEKQLDRLDRKAKKKSKGGVTDTDLEWLSDAGFDALLDTKRTNLWLFDGNREFQVAMTSGDVKQGVLPVGTVRSTHKGYEEVRVPPVRVPAVESEHFISIEEFEDWAQLAFQGYKTLNRIQSRIFQTAYRSNENILVCAPTGAGKTNIAMITVLREIGLHRQFEIIQKAEFKIVYVAPMKALAAEVTANFSRRLAPLGLKVRELTGDTQLSKREMTETQMIVTTPEKWDVITRKGGDVSMAALVRLLIIDEVHLLNDDRGSVIETLIARTLRQVEVSQSMIRIVGLSATLPNYRDVATFLAVNLETGLFYFDASYRPVPLAMQFVGVSEKNFVNRNNVMNEVCYKKIVSAIKRGKQAMVFVHSRKETGKSARILGSIAQRAGEAELFMDKMHPDYPAAVRDISKSRNKEVAELFPSGFGIHHAGMLRTDRSMMERLFASGVLKVLCCTATLAWGVNLPAHTVIIKGTQLYDSQKGAFRDVGMLDVQQIFGRAGRPQFDTSGEGIIITSHDKLAHYLGMLTHQAPIESQFTQGLVDHLNAEIVLGTVTTVKEAITWLSYTYLFVRMLQNPLPYGISWEARMSDERLEAHRRDLIVKAARKLEKSKMARFDEKSGQLYVTELGRVASHFYIRHETVETFNGLLKKTMTEAEVLAMMSHSSEFESMMVREEELPELDRVMSQGCPYEVRGGVENKEGKVDVLMQAYVSRVPLEAFSLIADMMYISQNAARIARAIFEICLRRGWSSLADILLTLCKCFERRLWTTQHALRQFDTVLSPGIIHKLEERRVLMDVLYESSAEEIDRLIRHTNAGALIKECLAAFPKLDLVVQLHPITRSVLQVKLEITPAFKWRDAHHGGVMRWIIWVEDSENEHIYHTETWLLTKMMMRQQEPHRLVFTIPISEPLPAHYVVRVINDSWVESEAFAALSFKSLMLPSRMGPHTELLDLDPLPKTVLNNPHYEALYSHFTHFNPIQTQAFHTLYHTDKNVLLGAPTGSGKTISAELAMMRVFNEQPDKKIIYIAPIKALVRERLNDWGRRLCPSLGKRMVELTGDYTPDIRALKSANIIIATPEKWDGISRNWQTRSYVRNVCLMVIDEIHLLGADRGPIIEVIVSRMRYIASQTDQQVRLLGLSTALANAPDVADWMGVEEDGLFNFRPSVRPVPLECHIQGYPGKFYCPRMATMNKPAYAAIQTYCPVKPVLVFVSSRRQTRLTALDLIAFAAADERPEQFLHMGQDELEEVLEIVKDSNLKHTLQFGIGLHHAGLNDRDRSIVERLFVECKIQLLVATSTLAWGVNTPAHLVIIKGTEYFDAPTRRYVDFPITDVLQMMGRAGRPQFDQHGVAVIMVHEPKKAFYKKFLYEPFPVESSLPAHLAEHLSAEVVAGTIATKQDAVDYLTWTFFFRRLLRNPSFYDLKSIEQDTVNEFLSGMVEDTLKTLETAGCVTVHEDDTVEATTMGRISSFFYLRHSTMAVFMANLKAGMDFKQVLQVLCHTSEYDDLPVRHNEDKLNMVLSGSVRWRVDPQTLGDPHTKANLLLQAHLSRKALPISDYVSDTKSVLDNSLRIMQAMVDIAADAGWLGTALTVMNLIQSVMQARWVQDSSLLSVPSVDARCVEALEEVGISCLPQLLEVVEHRGSFVSDVLSPLIGNGAAEKAVQVCRRLPVVTVKWEAPTVAQAAPPQDRSGTENGTPEAPETDEGELCSLQVTLQCGRLQGRGRGVAPAFAPRYPKVKDEGWWLVLGDPGGQELLALKRLSLRDGQPATVKLEFNVPDGRRDAVTLFLMSDCYIGLDQQYAVELPQAVAVVETSARA